MPQRRTAPAICTLTLILLPLSGCSGILAPCAGHASSPEASLTAFLTAAHENDASSAQLALQPGYTVDAEAFDRLHETLADSTVADLRLSLSDRMSIVYFYRVLDASGAFLGQFEVQQLETGCFATAWGHWRDPE